jgi:predicted MFS family arabinose efflux permease
VAARLLAGVFGGPLTSLSMALIIDYISPERRGRAMGKVAGAFAAASVLGVPFGLELSTRISWHAPFVVTAFLAAAVLLLVVAVLPHRPALERETSLTMRALHLWNMLKSPLPLTAYMFMGLTMMGGFMIIPNIAAHLQLNLHYPREHMGMLYLCGGLVSFFGMRASGWMVDRYSSTVAISLFTLGIIAATGAGFIFYPSPVPIMLIFILFMVSMSGRMVAAQTLASKIPAPHERAAFLSIQSAITHLGSAVGAYYSSLILHEQNGQLLHMPTVGYTAIGIAVVVLVLVRHVERIIVSRGSAH